MIDFNQFDNKPDFINNESIDYLVLVGSHAYGGATPESDYDFYGFVIPPIEYIFPHASGYIDGFDGNKPSFEQFEMHHVDTQYGKTDVSIYNIVKYFKLIMACNPNMLHSLFAPPRCIHKQNAIANLLLTYKHLFLSRRVYYTFRGIAFSHFKKMQSKNYEPDSRRAKIIQQYGYDTKDASYCLRFLWELEEILLTCNLNIDRFGKEVVAVRNGKYNFQQIKEIFNKTNQKLKDIMDNRVNSALPKEPNINKIRNLLIDCISFRHGCLSRFGYNVLS